MFKSANICAIMAAHDLPSLDHVISKLVRKVTYSKTCVKRPLNKTKTKNLFSRLGIA